MDYQVLARKWRSKTFADVVGQPHAVHALTHALRTGRLHHAYLFTGTRGVGKTSLARLLAKSLNCIQGVVETPCGVCTACVQIEEGRFVDVLEIDAASHTGIDHIREVLENAQYAAHHGRFKVYIIDEVHMLSKSAFNAMLKTLEEPPPHVKFILATTDPQKLPVTVLSRCLQFHLKAISPSYIAQHLQFIVAQEHTEADPEALTLLSQAAHGSMRDALSLLDQAIGYGAGVVTHPAVCDMLGTVSQSQLLAVVHAIADGDGVALLHAAEALAAASVQFDAALQALALLLHQIALFQSIPTSLDPSVANYAELVALAPRLSAQTVQLLYQIAVIGRRDLVLAPDAYAGFSMTLLRMLAFAPFSVGDSTQVGVAVQPISVSVAAPKSAQSSARPQRLATALPLPSVHSDSPASSHSAPEELRVTPAATPATLPAAPPQNESVDWATVVSKLALTGMLNMLAKHCILEKQEDEHWQFQLPAQHRALLQQQHKLRDALSTYCGAPQQIKITLTTMTQATLAPIQLEENARQQAGASATEALMADPIVCYLQAHAGARLVAHSVEVLQAIPTQMEPT